jgi:uncharacterized protein YlxP (DUF503 family)
MVVAVGSLVLMVHDAGSLKAKRSVIKSVLGRARAKFDLSIAEVADMDKWQKSRLGFAVVSNEAGHAHAMLENVVRYIEDLRLAEVVEVKTELLHYGDEFEGNGRYEGGSALMRGTDG